MCLPSKKLYRGASCLFCLKKSFNVRTLSLVLLGWRYGWLLAAFGQSVTHEKTAKNPQLAS